ncbi:MAG: LCP family protein [Acidimicrobiales bacterium]
MAILVVIALLLIGGVGYAYHLTHGFQRMDVHGLAGALTTGQEAGTENILMAGSTSRCALTVQNPAYGLCSQGVNGVNSDVIMILHVDPAHHRLALLSIPRDLFIPNARSGGANKIDAGLYQGLSQLVSAIEDDFGIPIQHAVSLNFDQFANVVDALGGINMSFPISVFDAESGLNVQAATCVHLNGTQALQVVRARHLQYKSSTSGPYAAYWPQEYQSDLARIRRDHEFLRVLAAAAAKKGLGNPITDINLVNSLKADFTFDQSWSVTDMARLLLDFHSVHINSIPQLTLPVAVVIDPNGPGGSLIYRGAAYGQVEFPASAADRTAIDQVLGIGPNVDALTGQTLPPPSAVTVSVMNGTGVANQAGTTATALGALGFHTVGVGDTPPTGDMAETVVYYGSHAPAAEAAAEAVANSMSGSVIIGYNPTRVTDGAQVTVVTGTQFAVAPPAHPAGVAGSPSTSAPTATAPTSADIAPPSAPNPNLAPWDPRACPPGATPTTPVANPVR